MPRWRYTVTDPVPTHFCAVQRYKHFLKSKQYEQNFRISKEKQPLQTSYRRFAGRSVRIVTMGSHLFCHHRSLMSRTQRQASRLSMGLAWLGLHSARRIHCNVILAHSVIFIHLGGQRDRSVSQRATRCSIYRDIGLSSFFWYHNVT